MEPIIKVENLSFSYDLYEENQAGASNFKLPIPALRNVNLSFSEGEYVAILGHNGSGKSTFAKLLNMILTPTEGKIYIDGKDITAEDMTEDDVFEVRKTVGMVFQNPDNQLVATLVEEDVAFGPENLGLPREEIRKRVDSSLELVGMTEYARHAPHKLSGGQKQRIAIAGIIAMKPKIIVFDESTAMLDPLGRKEVIRIMEKLNREENITVLNITHYMDEAARADRVIVINDGEITLDGSAKEVFSNVDKLHEMGLEAPQGVELIHALNKSSLGIDENVLTEEECTKAIISFLKGEK